MATTKGWDAAEAGERLARFRFPATGIRDKDSLFQAVRDTLPLDPPLATSNWDGLLDSLTSGLAYYGCENVVLLWPEAREMRAASPDDFAIALESFDDVAEMLISSYLPAISGRPMTVHRAVNTFAQNRDRGPTTSLATVRSFLMVPRKPTKKR